MIDYTNRRFIIFDISEIDKVNFNDTYETSADFLRISTDGLKTFVEFNLPIPAFLENLETKSELLTYDEIINTLQNPPWISLDEGVPYPEDGNQYYWNEETLTWELITIIDNEEI